MVLAKKILFAVKTLKRDEKWTKTCHHYQNIQTVGYHCTQKTICKQGPPGPGLAQSSSSELKKLIISKILGF